MTRRALVTFATVGLVFLVVANVITALTAGNALPPTRADDDTVLAPPPESMLRAACGKSNVTEPQSGGEPVEGPQSTPEDGCPGDAPAQAQDPCTGECTETVPESPSYDDQAEEPCGEGCELPQTPTPEEDATPLP